MYPWTVISFSHAIYGKKEALAVLPITLCKEGCDGFECSKNYVHNDQFSESDQVGYCVRMRGYQKLMGARSVSTCLYVHGQVEVSHQWDTWIRDGIKKKYNLTLYMDVLEVVPVMAHQIIIYPL